MSLPVSSVVDRPFARARRLISGAPHPHLEMLGGQARRAEAASALLVEFFEADWPEASSQRMVELEAEARTVNNMLSARLSADFLTPLDAEDVQAVSTSLTRVVQSARRAADAGRELPSRRRLAPVQRELTVMVGKLCDAVDKVAKGQPAFEQAGDALRHQRHVRISLRAATAALVHREGDIFHMVASRQLHAALEEMLHRLRKSVTCLQWLILKNG